MPTNRAQAFRFLRQATCGPKPADVDRVMAIGAAAWIDEQLALPAQQPHLAYWRQMDADMKAANANASAAATGITASIWRQMLSAQDQLRQRMAFVWSQIMVVSTLELSGPRSEAAASYYDLLTRNALGSFRTLLGEVSVHPAMGLYLSHLANEAEIPATGQIPDQNYAREVMQLFSIGLLKLNPDGTPTGEATYGQADVEGMARVMTGWSWAGPDTVKGRWLGLSAQSDPNKMALPMQPYPQYHEAGSKVFLGTTIPAGTDARTTMNTALDVLANHASCGPSICRQLIQRLVTSHPRPAYVARVVNVWNNNGAAQRGDLGAVVKAILLDPDNLALAA